MKQPSHTSTDNTLAILHEIGRAFGRIPNLFQAFAKHPPLLEANWNKVKALLMQGRLSRLTKETIALVVSHDNGCTYCVAAHTAAMKHMGMTGEQIDGLAGGNLSVHLSPRDAAMIGFARKANQRHHDIGENDYEQLFSLGYSEAEIVEALGTMELFAGFNRFAKAMKVEVDF